MSEHMEPDHEHRVLLPAERMALSVALAQVLRGEDPTPNVATVCVLALARLDGRHDWYSEDSPLIVDALTEREPCETCDGSGRSIDRSYLYLGDNRLIPCPACGESSVAPTEET